MTDREIRSLLASTGSGNDVGFRLKVIEKICLRQQRAASLRRMALVIAAYGLLGITCGLLGQSDAGRQLLEPLAVSAVFCLAAGELAAWVIDGRSLLAGRLL